MTYPEPQYHCDGGEASATLAGWARDGRPSDAEVADFYRHHDNHWLPDPRER